MSSLGSYMADAPSRSRSSLENETSPHSNCIRQVYELGKTLSSFFISHSLAFLFAVS